MHSGAFFCHEGVPGGKVDEDCVSRVRLQKLANYVVVLQPVLSERVVGEKVASTNSVIFIQRTTYWLNYGNLRFGLLTTGVYLYMEEWDWRKPGNGDCLHDQMVSQVTRELVN